MKEYIKKINLNLSNLSVVLILLMNYIEIRNTQKVVQ